MSDMTPQGQLMTMLYDNIEIDVGDLHIINARLDNERMWRLERWLLNRKKKKLAKRIKYYERVLASKRRHLNI